jgi:peroxiredoxin
MLRRKFSLVCLAVLAAVASGVNAQNRLPGEWAKNALLDQVEAERELGKLSARDLVARYKQEISRDPKNPEPYVKAAAVYSRRESEQLYQKALALAPGYLPAQLGLARYYAEVNPKEALAEYQKAVALAPKDAALRNEAVRGAARVAPVEELRKLIGTSGAARLLLSGALLGVRKVAEAEKELSGIPSSPAIEGRLSLLKARLAMLRADQERNKDKQARLWNEAVETMVAAWRKDPAQRELYPAPLRTRSLSELLTGQKRYREAAEALEKGIELFPADFYLQQMRWKSRFAEPKPSYAAEKQQVGARAAALLEAHPPSPELLMTVAAGFRMADDISAAEQATRRLLAAYPYSTRARELRFGEMSKAKDPREKALLWAGVNRDFPSFYPLQLQEYFITLDKTDAPGEELRKAAQAAIDDIRDRGYGNMFLALRDIANVYLRRNIYLDDLQGWADQAQANPDEILKQDTIGLEDGMILTIRARLMAAGRAGAAETILRRLIAVCAIDRKAVNAEFAFHLADLLNAQGKKDEALELYARAAADSGGFLPSAEKKFRALYQELKGSEAGADEYLVKLKGGASFEKEAKMNTPAPAFDFVQIGGGRVRLAELRGKVVILNFWATWCGPCLKELPHFQKFYEAKKDDPGVAVFAVTVDEERALVEPFVKARKFTFPVVFDDGRHEKLGIPPIPATLVIDPAGNLRLRNTGFTEGDDIESFLNKLVEEYRTTPARTAAK